MTEQNNALALHARMGDEEKEDMHDEYARLSREMASTEREVQQLEADNQTLTKQLALCESRESHTTEKELLEVIVDQIHHNNSNRYTKNLRT